jgi:methylphosphotriester-DNA--protein-cysteine methyltransferase
MKKRTLLKSLLAVAFVCATVAFAGEGAAVKGNPNSKIYHKPACKYYAAKGSTKEFKTETAAVKAGYTVCKKCGKAKEATKGAVKKK